jgi:Arm domain-containing DNA-binding protein
MARKLDRLSARSIASKRKPGYYCDGGGLYLQVSDAGTKSWVFRFKLNGKTRDMGLGALHTIGLAEARTRAAAARVFVHDGVDPIVARDEKKRALALDTAKTKTFAECAVAYIKAHRSEWRDAKHAAQWTNTLCLRHARDGNVTALVPEHPTISSGRCWANLRRHDCRCSTLSGPDSDPKAALPVRPARALGCWASPSPVHLRTNDQNQCADALSERPSRPAKP